MCDSMMGSAGASGGTWLLSALLMFAVLAGAIAAVVVLAGMVLRRPVVASAAPGEAHALAVAKERYARGEIDHDELNRILDTLLRTEGRTDPGRW